MEFFVPGSAASPTSEASAIQRLEASLAKVESSPASSPDMSRSVWALLHSEFSSFSHPLPVNLLVLLVFYLFFYLYI